MKIKSKLDILTIMIVLLFLVVLTVTFISNRYIIINTKELVNISRELDYLTIIKSSLTHLKFNLEDFIMRPDSTSKKNVEDAIDKLYRIIGRAEDFILDEDEQEIVGYLRNNMAGFFSSIHSILISKDENSKKEMFSDLKKRYFMKTSSNIDKHWEEDLKKVRKLQIESQRQLALSSYISLGVFSLLLVSVFLSGIL